PARYSAFIKRLHHAKTWRRLDVPDEKRRSARTHKPAARGAMGVRGWPAARTRIGSSNRNSFALAVFYWPRAAPQQKCPATSMYEPSAPPLWDSEILNPGLVRAFLPTGTGNTPWRPQRRG